MPESAVRTIGSSYATLPWKPPSDVCERAFDHSSRIRRSGAGLMLCIAAIARAVSGRSIGTRSQRTFPATATPFGDPSYRNGP